MICGADIKFDSSAGFLDAISSWEPLMLVNILAGIPTMREPSMISDDELLSWWGKKDGYGKQISNMMT